MNRKIVVGMSGGVDSSVAALLLKEAGWDVVGVMLRLWGEDLGQKDRFCDDAAIERARIISEKIGIPFYAPDVRQFFYDHVVTPFMDEYIAGRTPNPCTMCNPFVRWVKLLEFADEIGADWMATGHYACISSDEDKTVHLTRGWDEKKDQSYVLARLHSDQLLRTVLPLGKLTKPQVRKIAAEHNLQSAETPDSQDICFIADGDYRRFLKSYRSEKIASGDIVSTDGRVIGKHEGLPFYTVGQRKGLYIFDPEPNYVLEKDVLSNRLIVGKKEYIGKDVVEIAETNWINPLASDSFISDAQFRYKSRMHTVQVQITSEKTARLLLNEPLYDIANGQLAVLYKNGTEVLGSGVIQKTGKKQ